jgi:hypothetical protein
LASQEAREHRPQLRDAWGLPRQDVVFIAVVKLSPGKACSTCSTPLPSCRTVNPTRFCSW